MLQVARDIGELGANIAWPKPSEYKVAFDLLALLASTGNSQVPTSALLEAAGWALRSNPELLCSSIPFQGAITEAIQGAITVQRLVALRVLAGSLSPYLTLLTRERERGVKLTVSSSRSLTQLT